MSVLDQSGCEGMQVTVDQREKPGGCHEDERALCSLKKGDRAYRS
jgi:hypothetical protein